MREGGEGDSGENAGGIGGHANSGQKLAKNFILVQGWMEMGLKGREGMAERYGVEPAAGYRIRRSLS